MGTLRIQSLKLFILKEISMLEVLMGSGGYAIGFQEQKVPLAAAAYVDSAHVPTARTVSPKQGIKGWCEKSDLYTLLKNYLEETWDTSVWISPAKLRS
jgi:hypothetical protein